MTSEQPEPRDTRDTQPAAPEVPPELLAAARDVDRTLIRHYLGLSIRERLRACTKAARALGRFHRAPSSTG